MVKVDAVRIVDIANQTNLCADRKIEIPKLMTGQVSVIFTEAKTGILLNTQGSYYLGQGEFFVIFASESEALLFANSHILNHPEVECSIRNEDGLHLRFVTAS